MTAKSVSFVVLGLGLYVLTACNVEIDKREHQRTPGPTETTADEVNADATDEAAYLIDDKGNLILRPHMIAFWNEEKGEGVARIFRFKEADCTLESLKQKQADGSEKELALPEVIAKKPLTLKFKEKFENRAILKMSCAFAAKKVAVEARVHMKIRPDKGQIPPPPPAPAPDNGDQPGKDWPKFPKPDTSDNGAHGGSGKPDKPSIPEIPGQNGEPQKPQEPSSDQPSGEKPDCWKEIDWEKLGDLPGADLLEAWLKKIKEACDNKVLPKEISDVICSSI